MIDTLAIVIGYIVIGGAVLLFVWYGLDVRPVPGVTKITLYDQGLVVINKRKIDPKLLHHLYQLGYTIWDVRYPYALAPSYTNLVLKYQAWRADRRGEN